MGTALNKPLRRVTFFDIPSTAGDFSQYRNFFCLSDVSAGHIFIFSHYFLWTIVIGARLLSNNEDEKLMA